jgi:hypothetical protein
MRTLIILLKTSAVIPAAILCSLTGTPRGQNNSLPGSIYHIYAGNTHSQKSFLSFTVRYEINTYR